MRGKMGDPSKKSYSPPFAFDEFLNDFGVSVVLRSENAGVKVGDHLYGYSFYFIRKNLDGLQKSSNPRNLPCSHFIGVLGMPDMMKQSEIIVSFSGKTAIYAWNEYSKAKAVSVRINSSRNALISSPFISLVIQLAKAQGLEVIGSAASDQKVALIKEIGPDVAFNYKTCNALEIREREMVSTPSGSTSVVKILRLLSKLPRSELVGLRVASPVRFMDDI
ncbi:hypothetical protein BJ165DRAFT_1567809 [Panaeolus papilionaceus]|nr:hypothetical protein BJ165DRAFT_1567809 [Panaeolus papilionaceus]